MILKCKMCGGDIELNEDKTCGICSYCGSTMTFPKVDDEQRANRFNRGNQFRRAGEFDKALAVYEQIVQEDENDAEAHWCCALCRFGIEYVEDPNTFEYIPTCHRASFDSFLEDVDYLAAVEHSDGITRRQYQKDAAKIAEVQRGILATSQNEEPFDVFICYKETEDDGTRTRDSLYAQDIYYQLTEQGRRVFFSRITLEDKTGTQFEPYIFAALNSAKVMILVTTSAEHANSVWVKNEWSRFLGLMRKDRTKLLLPCYRDMDPYDLPEALSVLQSYDMSRIGFIQDLIRGVNKVLNAAKPKPQAVKETVIVQPANPTIAPLLKRTFLFLEDGDFDRADEFCEQVLNLDPENGLAYLCKLMAELKVTKREQLKDQPQPFDGSKTYQKVMRFGDEDLRAELTGCIARINERNEIARQKGVYESAVAAMGERSIAGYKRAAEIFGTIPQYADAKAKQAQCLEQAELIRQDGIYYRALTLMGKQTTDALKEAARLFLSIPDYKNAREKAADCDEMAKELIREATYKEAMDAASEGTEQGFLEAAKLLASIPGYKDAQDKNAKYLEKVEAIRKDQVYREAVKLSAYRSMEELEEAARLFGTISGYKDADKQLFICRNKIQDLLAKEESKRIKRQQKEQQDRADEEHRKNRKRSRLPIVAAAVAICFALGLIIGIVVMPGIRAKKETDVELPGQTSEQGSGPSAAEIWSTGRERKLMTPTIATGESHTVALKENGTAVAVGNNGSGQCQVEDWTDLVMLAAGTAHTVGLKADGTAVAVGNTSSGRCNVSKWTDMVAVAAGGYHTVGLKADGTVKAVGGNGDGQCNVLTWTDIIAIAAGDHHTLGLKADGTVVAVGYNYEGQCNVSAWSDIVAVAAGDEHSVGLKADGTVVAVGYNGSGRCNVSNWTDIVAIAAGGAHTVGLKADGTVVAVGQNSFGQLNVSDWKDIVTIAAGQEHTVGLKADGTVVAVGKDSFRQCSGALEWTGIRLPGETVPTSSTNVSTTAPTQASTVSPTQESGINYSNPKYPKAFWDQHAVHSAIAASNHTVAIKTDGTVVATGSNDHGQCNVSSWKNIVAIAAGYQHSIGLKSDGTVVATEYTGDQTDNRGQCEVSEWAGIVAIAAGPGCSVGLKSDGTVVATGQMKTKVSSWTDIIAITAGETHIVAVKNDGTVVAYGNASGQGNVSDWKNIVAIAAGNSHTVGLKADGTVIATGRNEDGQCNVSDWTDITAIAAASTYTIGLKKDGMVVIAGSEDVKKKLDVSRWKDIVAIAAGHGHVVGLKSDGTMVAVGSKTNGKLDISGWTDIRLPNTTSQAQTDAIVYTEPTAEMIAVARNGIVSKNNVNMRHGPDTDSLIVSYGLKQGTKLTVYHQQGDFFFVKVDETGEYGYIPTRFVELSDAWLEGAEPPAGTVLGVIACPTLALRAAPAVTAESLGVYYEKQQVFIYYQEGDYYYVRIADSDAVGYMSATFIRPDGSVPSKEDAKSPADLQNGEYADKFSDTVVSNEKEYRSRDISIQLTTRSQYVCNKCHHLSNKSGACPNCGATIRNSNDYTVSYTVADIYIKSLDCLKSAYGENMGDSDTIKDMCENNRGILAVNTDYYLASLSSKRGLYVRNGSVIGKNDNLIYDLCILHRDGTMETVDVSAQAVDCDSILQLAPWQVWCFGPALLGEDGSAKTGFTDPRGICQYRNARTAIGYYEPGHYCFLVVDGNNGARGVTMEELSQLCFDLGLSVAYNMDGGATSGLYFNGNIYGSCSRDTSDIVYIAKG